MQWFKNEYDRAGMTEYVLQEGLASGLSEEYVPGFRRTTCSAPEYGAIAIIQHFPFRKVYDRELGYDVPINNPFYRVELSYTNPVGKKINALIEFNERDAMLKRSLEHAAPLEKQRNPDDVWDEAMAAFDATLIDRALRLGCLALPEIVGLAA